MNSNNHNNRSPPSPTSNVTILTVQRMKQQAKAFSNNWSQHVRSQISAPTIDFNNNNNYINIKHHTSELEQKNQRMQKQIIQLQQEKQTWQEEKRALKLENSKLKLVVRGLAQFVKEGPPPQHIVPKMKPENCPWTIKINECKQTIQKYYFHKFGNSVSPNIDIQPSDHKNDNTWITDKALSKRIENHQKINGEYNSKPQILLAKRKDKRRYSGTIKDILRIEDCEKRPIKDVVETVKISTGHRVKALENSLGLRGKCFMPKGTVLGQYVGTEYLTEEFETVYDQSVEYYLRNMYAFETTIYVPKTEENDNENDVEMDGIDNEGYYENARKVNMIIDGWDKRKENRLIYINDCRKDIYNEQVSVDDEKYWNCSFKTVHYNGYPMVFVITRKDINVGEELNIYYGAGYGRAVNQKDKYELFMARIRGLIDNNILKILGMEGGIPDVYILD